VVEVPVPGDARTHVRPEPRAAARAQPEPIDGRRTSELLAIARSYVYLTRADGSWWAPEDCRAPIHPSFASKAQTGGHGRKIYTLFIKDMTSYAALSGAALDVQPNPMKARELASMPQVIVKEAWTPIESAKWREACTGSGSASFLAPVSMNGGEYRACEPAGLFVMYRPSDPGDDSDDGWIYGTVAYERRAEAPDAGGSWLEPRVTSAGRVDGCMGCHTRAPHGRLFGLPRR
jgi:hypothetical protein